MTSGNLNLQHLSLSCKFSLYHTYQLLLNTNNLLLQITCSRLVNRLTNKTLKKLVSCLHYQNYMLLDDHSRGLLHIFLEVIYYCAVNILRKFLSILYKLPLSVIRVITSQEMKTGQRFKSFYAADDRRLKQCKMQTLRILRIPSCRWKAKSCGAKSAYSYFIFNILLFLILLDEILKITANFFFYLIRYSILRKDISFYLHLLF